MNVDDTRCAACGRDVFDTVSRSISITEWNPQLRGNVLLAVVCDRPTCLVKWARTRAAVL